MVQTFHVLYEHASGYALFKVKEFEEMAMFLPEVEQSATDISKFNSIVNLVSFSPFKSGTNALDNINSISEGILHDDLKLFLETNLPKASKKSKSLLGIGDAKLGAAISEMFDNVSVKHTGVTPEIIRGVRYHFHHLVKGLTEKSQSKAQLGLGHSYSRCKVKFNVNRVDNMIIQSIALLDQLDKDINTFSMRIREWYSYHFPELIKIVKENNLFARCVKIIKNRKEMTDEKVAELEEVLMDSALAKAVLDASKSSMGMDISPVDLINIQMFCSRVIALADYRKSLYNYLHSKMSQVAPNLAALIGEQVGARLISHAGSLTNLAKYPASTVQILGAEKALFRALKTRGNTPKYGLIYHSTFIGRAAAANKGRISRYLANKCSIASRIDCFSENQSSIYGEHLREQVEDRLKFYDSGETPKKNIDVMREASSLAKEAALNEAKKDKKQKKKDKKKKRKSGAAEEVKQEAMETDEPPKKKKKADVTLNETTDDDAQTPKKKKKKSKDKSMNETMETDTSVNVTTDDTDTPSKKKKKKKKSS
ncbi:nucleolar protein 56-like [Tubulanus polymorphus]|uniref:nucleolar protein 56-like n=1 Tax=Tubulanus polymorphus TaxID=672921 RepID=UPI003DA4BC87